MTFCFGTGSELCEIDSNLLIKINQIPTYKIVS